MTARVVAIFGPTASGKSALALDIAERIDGEIVSCDAMQVYRGLEILTNQPTAAERDRVPHHLVGVLDPADAGDVATYADRARTTIDAILERGKIPIVVGGTGLYLRAALGPLDLPPRPPDGLRERLAAEYDAAGAAAAHARLATLDPAAAARIHAHDRRRVVRALELVELGSSLAGDALFEASYRHPTRVIGLVVPRGELHRRIEVRTRAMFAAGVVDEVRAVVHAGPLSQTARRALGLDDVTALIAGEIDEEECIRRLVVRTRQYARRQETWMRRLPQVELVDAPAPAAALLA